MNNLVTISIGLLAGVAVFLFVRRDKAMVEDEKTIDYRTASFDDVFPNFNPDFSFTIPGISKPATLLQPQYDYEPITITEYSPPSLNDITFDDDPPDYRDQIVDFFTFDNPFAGLATMIDDEFDPIFVEFGNLYGVDWRLLKAIAFVESGFDANAKNPADPSYGLMQVYCVTNTNDQNEQCKNLLNVSRWNEATPAKLKNPSFNVQIAAQILKWNLDNYGYPHGIAVYNSWSARHDSPSGPFRNQGYVDKVTQAYSDFGGVSNEPDFT